MVPFEHFPVNTYDADDPGIDFNAWNLKVTGDVEKPGEYALAQIQALPRQRQNTRHICVEGWDVIGRFGGARLSDFLNLAGANPRARFVYVECADDYYTAIDMATARHAQSLLCYEMYDRPFTREHGAPVRLSIPTKIGYKNAKYLTRMHVTDVLAKRLLEDQGLQRLLRAIAKAHMGRPSDNENHGVGRQEKAERKLRAVYEHPFLVRLCHWINSVALLVLIASGLRIFRAFPSFGPKIPHRISSISPRNSRSAAGLAARCNGILLSFGFTPARACSTSPTKFSAGITAKCSSCPRYSRSLAHGAPLFFLGPSRSS